MEIEQVAEMARTVAALPQPERDFFDGMVADERAKAAEAERIAVLRSMSDKDALQHVIHRYVATNLTGDGALQMLQEAGFVREKPKQKMEFIFPTGHHIELYGDHASLGAVRVHLCDAVPGIKYSKGA